MLMPALPRTVRQVRSHARWLLGTWQLESMSDTVELLVSELVTNAINATGITDEENGAVKCSRPAERSFGASACSQTSGER
jgi:hypothetical protein